MLKKIAGVFFILLLTTIIFAQAKVDPKLPAYQKTSGISGNLSSVGSDTLLNLMTFWSEGFAKIYPSVKFQIEGKGSSTAPPAMIEGTAQFGPMSRKMKDKEIDAFVKKFGYKPVVIAVAIDNIAVYVNKNNPIKGLSLQEVDAMFSSTRSGGNKKDIKTWGDAGMSQSSWKRRPVSLYGRNSASGTYGYFKKVALYGGDYKNTVKEQPGSASVVQGIEKDKFGIGYSGIGYKTSGVRAIPLAKEGKDYYEPNVENALSGKYPLARSLYVYINKKPGTALDPKVKEFMKYVLSKAGQEVVVKDGYFPLPASAAEKELAKLD